MVGCPVLNSHENSKIDFISRGLLHFVPHYITGHDV